jgi:hypothetical protein
MKSEDKPSGFYFSLVHRHVLDALEHEYVLFEDRKRAADEIVNGLWDLCVKTVNRLSLKETEIQKLFIALSEVLLPYALLSLDQPEIRTSS